MVVSTGVCRENAYKYAWFFFELLVSQFIDTMKQIEICMCHSSHQLTMKLFFPLTLPSLFLSLALPLFLLKHIITHIYSQPLH